MGWFSFNWLKSKQREEIKKELPSNKPWDPDDLPPGEMKMYPIIRKQVYKNIYFDGSTITVVFEDGTFCSKPEGTRELLEQIKEARSRHDILSLLYPNITESVVDTKDDKEYIMANAHVLKGHPDFTINGLNINLKGVSLAIPSVIVASFIEVLEKNDDEKYQALKAFWMWLALNPIESSRNDALTFIKANDVNITSNGLLELYRRVVNVGEKNKELSQFISTQYFRIKKWKKSPKNYYVWTSDEGIVELRDSNYDKPNGIEKFHGSLEDMYLDLPNMQENIYTDAHTHSKIIRIGQVYKENEEDVDLDNSVSCSKGLHVGSHTFMFSGFGDTGVLCLVNPSKIRSVPNHESNKMRVSEMFIAAVVGIADYKTHIEEGDLIDYSQVYYNQSVAQLEDMVKGRNFSKMECQEFLPAVSLIDIDTIKNELKTRVKAVNICQ